jgi:uncharacterized protein (TIGR03437 family)
MRVLSLFLVSLPLAAQIQITAVTTSAGFVPGLPGLGGLATIFVRGLTGVSGIIGASSFPLPYQIAGVQVRFGSLSAPILAVADLGSYQQINVQVPYETPSFTIQVIQGTNSAGATPNFDNAPGEFFDDGTGRALVQHGSDYSLVTPANPASKGEVLIAYASGLGTVSPPVGSGYAAPENPPSYLTIANNTATNTFAVRVGGNDANVLFAGLTPGYAGLDQLNFRVPQLVGSGDVILQMVQNVCGNSGCNTLTSRAVRLAIR